ncbi:hypothetical protein GCM10010349_20680 [Streptomyces flavofungini]|nr:hypothetical protein GCM10010349_20680 [Streptomyces flavofungini]
MRSWGKGAACAMGASDALGRVVRCPDPHFMPHAYIGNMPGSANFAPDAPEFGMTAGL